MHERELNTGFLLIVLREVIQYPHLKLVPMLATINADLFSQYFGNCPIINVPGRTFDVDVFYLDNLLLETQYKSEEMCDFLPNDDN